MTAQAGQNLQIREDPKTGIFVHGLTQIHVKTMQQLIMYVQTGLKRRNVNMTGMNKNSSRSHAVLQILVEQRWVVQEPTSAQKEVGGNTTTAASQGAGGALPTQSNVLTTD